MLDYYDYKKNIIIYLIFILSANFLPASYLGLGILLQISIVLIATYWMYLSGVEIERIGSVGIPMKFVKILCFLSPFLALVIVLAPNYFDLPLIQQTVLSWAFVLNFFCLIGVLIRYKAELELKFLNTPKNHYIVDFISFGLVVIAMYKLPELLKRVDKAKA